MNASNYFEQWADLVKKAQQPMQELAELNMKTLKEFDTKVLEKVINTKKPEELLELQVKFAVENSKKSLDYFEKSMRIFEKSVAEFNKEVKAAKNASH